MAEPIGSLVEFVKGQDVLASEMNANFEAIVTEFNDLVTGDGRIAVDYIDPYTSGGDVEITTTLRVVEDFYVGDPAAGGTVNAYFQSYTGDVYLYLDAGKDGNVETAGILFRQGNPTVEYWKLFMATDRSFSLYDSVADQDAIHLASDGIMTLTPAGEITNVSGIVTVGDGGVTDYTEFEADGTMEFHGAATVWDDLRVVPGAFEFAGVSDPTLENWQPGASGATFKVWKFKKDDEVFVTCQLPHTYKQGTDLYPHIHWTPADRGTEEGAATVGWKIDYSWANVNAVFAASATINMIGTCNSLDDEHLIGTSPVAISGTSKDISSMLVLRIYRSDTGADDTWAGVTGAQSPVLLEFDLHFEIDTVGSRTEFNK